MTRYECDNCNDTVSLNTMLKALCLHGLNAECLELLRESLFRLAAPRPSAARSGRPCRAPRAESHDILRDGAVAADEHGAVAAVLDAKCAVLWVSHAPRELCKFMNMPTFHAQRHRYFLMATTSDELLSFLYACSRCFRLFFNKVSANHGVVSIRAWEQLHSSIGRQEDVLELYNAKCCAPTTHHLPERITVLYDDRLSSMDKADNQQSDPIS